MTLGLKQEAEDVKTKIEENGYKLTEEEKKLNFEKIKALKDPQDNLKDKGVVFHFEEENEPLVIE